MFLKPPGLGLLWAGKRRIVWNGSSVGTYRDRDFARVHPVLVLPILLLLLPFAAFSQGTVTDGSVSYSFKILDSEFDNGDLRPADGIDHLFETWWYFRMDADGFETRLRSPDTQSYVGNVATLGWSDIDSSGRADVILTITVEELSEGFGVRLTEEFEITNISGSPLTVNLYGYSDLDLTETVEDRAVLVRSPDHIEVFDDDTIMQYRGVGNDAFQVTDTQVAGSTLRDLLADGSETELDGSGLPFGPADWEGVFQWSDVAISSGASFTAVKTSALEPQRVFADGFE